MVDYEVQGHVAVLTINRPDKKNAVNGDVAHGMEAAIDQLEDDPDVWLGVLTHKGNVFSAGADLKAINEGRAGELATAKGGFGGITSPERTKPIIAAVDGPALAGGTEIVLVLRPGGGQHRRVASASPRSSARWWPAAGGLFRLPRVLPRNIALELGLTGDPITRRAGLPLRAGQRAVRAGPGPRRGPGAGRADRGQRPAGRARDPAAHDRAAPTPTTRRGSPSRARP